MKKISISEAHIGSSELKFVEKAFERSIEMALKRIGNTRGFDKD